MWPYVRISVQEYSRTSVGGFDPKDFVAHGEQLVRVSLRQLQSKAFLQSDTKP